MFKWLFKKKGCAKHMNNKLEVIGIDHGWSMMKTISQVFVTGVKEITTTPALFGDVLEYEGKFYKVGTVRQEVKDTKVEDDSFYLLTLAAVAKELKRRGLAEAKVCGLWKEPEPDVIMCRQHNSYQLALDQQSWGMCRHSSELPAKGLQR